MGIFSGSHILILLIVVLLIFGASKLPNAARSLGRSMRIFKSEMDEMKNDKADGANAPEAIEQQTSQANAIDQQAQPGYTEKHPESNDR